MEKSVSKYFVEKYYPENPKEDIEEKIEYYKEVMINRISQISWIDEQTKNYAIIKVKKIGTKIGYPDYIKNPKKLYEIYEKLKVDPNNFYINMYNFVIYMMNNTLKSTFNIKINNDIPVQVINAYNEPMTNNIVFPAGILQPSIYNTNEPDYIFYSSLGFIIGHELIHSFDNIGRIFDEDGNFKDWWTNSTLIKYENLTQCFIDQYNNYVFEDSKGNKYNLNGENTLNENIADNGGISRAYEAWKLSMSKNPKKAKERNFILPGLSEYTLDQLFYISLGQFLCSAEKDDYTINRIKTNKHSPFRYRINGIVSNSEHFAKTFNCPSNTKMNPKNKCIIW